MESRILYLIMVVTAGWVVTFALRSLPFLLFAGKDRQLPGWVAKLGNVVSPMIIGGLIIYSYATLKIGEGDSAIAAWKTIWPYLAGFLTVGLQLIWRNPLLSIIAGTVLYMCLVNCGCTTTKIIELDARKPSIRVSTQGFLIGNRYVKPDEIIEALNDYEIPHDRVIHILIDEDMETNLKPARVFMGMLAKNGYRRSVLVTKKHAESAVVTEEEKREREMKSGRVTPRGATSGKPKIRYKKGNE